MGHSHLQKIFWPVLATAWIATLFYYCLTPAPPKLEGPLGWDKLQHAIAFGLLACAIYNSCIALDRSVTLSSRIAFISATAFGGLIELLQGYLTKNRKADLYDFFADTLGAMIMIFLILQIQKQRCLLKKLFFALFIALTLPANLFGADADKITVSNEISNGVKRLSDESVDLLTTPFQLKDNNLFITAGILGATALTFTYDRDMQQKLQSSKSNNLNKAANIATIAGDPYLHLGIAALVYGGGIAADSQKWKQTGEMLGEALILADASTFIIKESAGRGRPSVTSSKSDFKPFGFKSDYDSFPSMHTSSSFAMASVLAATSESYLMKTAYYMAATFVGFSRMYKNKHWASDVLFGAALGELSGRVVTSYHASGRNFTIAPMAFQNGAGLAMVGKW